MGFAIAGGHEQTVEVAEEILRAGGNAFDAAVGALMAAFVTEPCMASAGGGAFATLMKANGEAVVLDFFCQTPKQTKSMQNLDLEPVMIDFGDEQETYYIGKGSNAIPGTLKGLSFINENFGRMPIKDLVQPAIKFAKEGVALNEFQQYDLVLLKDIFSKNEHYKSTFYNGETVKEIGDIINMPDLADFLDYYSKEGSSAFYKGEVANKIVGDHKDKGIITLADLSDFEVKAKKPFTFNYQQCKIHTNNYTGAGGPIIALILNDLEKGRPLEKSLLHLANYKNKPSLLNNALDQIMPGHNYLYNDKPLMSRGTSHFNVLDQWGNAISLTTSIGEGSGYFVEGTGIHINNMLGELGLLPNGINSWLPNQRLGSMMTPTILSKNGKARLVLGSGGATRIPYMIAQVIHEYATSKTLASAIDEARMYFDGSTMHCEQEKFLAIPANIDVHFWNKKTLFFGGVHAVSSKDGHLEAVGDARRFGAAVIG